MGSRPDYYRLLHVSDDAPLEVIRSSYRTLMKTMGAHPDLGGDGTGARELNEAWEVLSDPAARARYDAQRALREARDRVDAEPPPTGPRERSPQSPRPAPTAEPEPPTVTPGPRSPSPPEPNDRRAIARLKRDAPMTWAIGEGRSHESTIRDLSPRGLSFVTHAELEPGTTVQIRCEALWGRAIVRNARRLGEGAHLVGVEFDSVHFHDSRGTFVSRSA